MKRFLMLLFLIVHLKNASALKIRLLVKRYFSCLIYQLSIDFFVLNICKGLSTSASDFFRNAKK